MSDLTPADRPFSPGDVITAEGIGLLTVIQVFGPTEPGDYVEVDVEPEKAADIWDCAVLAAAVGADSTGWLSNTPNRRYRLYFELPTVIEG